MKRFLELSHIHILLSVDSNAENFEGQSPSVIQGFYYLNRDLLKDLHTASLQNKSLTNSDISMAKTIGLWLLRYISSITFEVHRLEEWKAMAAAAKANATGHEQAEKTKKVTSLVDQALASIDNTQGSASSPNDKATAKSTSKKRKPSKKSKGRGKQVPASSTPNNKDVDKSGKPSTSKMKPKKRKKTNPGQQTTNKPNEQNKQNHGSAKQASKSTSKRKRKQQQQQHQDGRGAKKQKKETSGQQA
jgi:hypothetical protein